MTCRGGPSGARESAKFVSLGCDRVRRMRFASGGIADPDRRRLGARDVRGRAVRSTLSTPHRPPDACRRSRSSHSP